MNTVFWTKCVTEMDFLDIWEEEKTFFQSLAVVGFKAGIEAHINLMSCQSKDCC